MEIHQFGLWTKEQSGSILRNADKAYEQFLLRCLGDVGIPEEDLPLYKDRIRVDIYAPTDLPIRKERFHLDDRYLFTIVSKNEIKMEGGNFRYTISYGVDYECEKEELNEPIKSI